MEKECAFTAGICILIEITSSEGFIFQLFHTLFKCLDFLIKPYEGINNRRYNQRKHCGGKIDTLGKLKQHPAAKEDKQEA